MFTKVATQIALLAAVVLPYPSTSWAAAFSFSTGSPDGKIATGSRPGGSVLEIESADDFILNSAARLTNASFYGLVPAGSSIDQVVVELYRVFPLDSTTPPSGRVPTRTNSPSDVAFDSRDSAAGGLTFTSMIVSDSFTAQNSVLNGINPVPNQTTLGEGPATGSEVLINVAFATPLDVPADHYFFIPQVRLSNGDFLWLSAPKPTTPPFTPDLQSWIRNENLAPDWLRIGTDVVGTGAFNGAFSIAGDTVPEPASWTLGAGGIALLAAIRRRTRRQ